MFLEIAVIILTLALFIITFFLYQAKKPTNQTNQSANFSDLTKFQEQQIASLSDKLSNSAQEIQSLKELVLTNFAITKLL